MSKLKLPIGYSVFRDIREWGCYHVDEMPDIHRLIEGGEY